MATFLNLDGQRVTYPFALMKGTIQVGVVWDAQHCLYYFQYLNLIVTGTFRFLVINLRSVPYGRLSVTINYSCTRTSTGMHYHHERVASLPSTYRTTHTTDLASQTPKSPGAVFSTFARPRPHPWDPIAPLRREKR
jgi:hypothetical protein